MMAFIEDGQLSRELIRQRDDYYDISYHDKKRLRADIPEPTIADGADSWARSGKAVQVSTTEIKMQSNK